MLRAMRVLLAGRLGFDAERRVRVGCSSVNPLILGGIGRRVRLFFAGDVRCGRGLLLIAFVRLAIVFEVLAIEGVFAVVKRVVYFVFRNVGQRGFRCRLRLNGLRRRYSLAENLLTIIAAGAWREGVCGLGLLNGRDLHRLRLGRALLRIGGIAVCGGLRDRRGLCAAHAVTLHFLGAKLLHDRGAYHFGDDVELAMLQAVVHDEANQRMTVHGQAVCACGCGEAGFAFACQGGIEAEEALVVVRIDKDGVERGRILLAGADHLFAAHLLFGFFHNLNGGDGRFLHLAGGTFEGVLHLSLELREESHGDSSLSAVMVHELKTYIIIILL